MSGTGFFINNRGYIVTNEHVVRGCRSVMIQGAVEPTTANVLDADEQYDLALLKTNVSPPRIPRVLQSDTRMRMGDPVMVIGYPLDYGIKGIHKVANAEIVGMEGPQNEPQWIQFSDAAQQGNSGGPLLDASGNIVGVVVGKATLTTYDTRTHNNTVIRKSDIAISLDVLKRFLKRNYIEYRIGYSASYLSPRRVENAAADYIVNIRCRPDGGMQALDH